MTKFSALEAALGAVWAMEENTLATVLSIAAREHDVTVEALEAYRAKSLERAEQATIRDGVAIISATGPMMKRANLFAAMSGATSYDILARDLTVARDNPKVKAAILNIDSGGGDASGAGELASMIKAFAAEKPIVAYVNGMGASAAYWLASAADEIVVDATAVLGSIGVRVGLAKREDPKGSTTFEFVSSQSPMKGADPATKEGAAHLQGIVDAMGQVFVEAVAANRGKSVATVLSDFGKGGMFVGQGAVKAGLADRVGTFEGVLAELSAARPSGRSKGIRMSEELILKSAGRSPAVPDARAAVLTRVANITKIGRAAGASDEAIAAAVDGDVTFEAFSLQMADKMTADRAARQLAEDREAAVNAILNAAALAQGDDIANSDLPAPKLNPAEALANEILASAKLAAGDDIGAASARVAAA